MIITVKGKVSSGLGDGKRFIQLPWIKKYVQRKFGFDPYPGTLNLCLPSNAQIFLLLKKNGGMRISAKGDFASGRFYKALIAGKIHGAIVRPEVSGYPENLLEVLAPINLREKLRLKDGDELKVKVWLK
mgnify:FL=1